MDKESKNRDYEKKKRKGEKKMENKQNKEEDYNNLVEPIQDMEPKDLLYFIEEKFEKVIQRNEKIFPKLTTAIANRLGAYRWLVKTRQ